MCLSNDTTNQTGNTVQEARVQTEEVRWLLCGHVNLHKSPACAAQLVAYINQAMASANLSMETGNIELEFPESKRFPRTVSEWNTLNNSRNAGLQGNQVDVDVADGDGQAGPSHAQDGRFQLQLEEFISRLREEERERGQLRTEQVPAVHVPEAFVFSVQEPHTHKEHITNISGGITICDEGAKTVRAAPIMSKTLNAWPVTEHMNPDQAVALIKAEGIDLYVVALYADCTKSPVSLKLKTLMAKVRKENAQILIMGDLNSHSESMLNGKRTCSRGKAWEDFVIRNNLMVQNRGDTFTFHTRKGQSIIDATISSAGIADIISGWEVKDAVPSSDHLLCQFAMQLSCTTIETRRDYRKCDWPKFKKKLENKSGGEPRVEWTIEDLESETSALLSDIDGALGNVCPTVTQTAGLRKPGWWGGECKRLYIRLQSIRRYLRWHDKYHNGQRARYTYEDLKQCRKGFKAECRRAKRKAWQTFIEDVESSPQVARLNHTFVKKLNKDI